ncbi:hypothetical protein RND81_13G164800 [Saponaria officinalis]|uniref:Uncharacterized protein n=1 Tax=Saponaria officinalis TaxID=3572 RepID=A0AAW1GYL7_SAPOF
MGAKSSKPSNETTETNINDELSSYLQACELDPEIQTFDSQLHEQTTQIINSLAEDGINNNNNEGFEVRSVSLDSIRQVIKCLIDMNQEVVRVFLEFKNDIWNNQELFDLVQDYFECTAKTLDFFTVLDKCLKRARDRQVIIRVSLLQFEDEMVKIRDGNFCDGKIPNFGKVLGELKDFKDEGDPFNSEFFGIFQSVYEKQVKMFEKLNSKKKKLDKKLRSLNAYRKVSNVIFAASFIAIIICSVVAAAISAPPVVTALAAAASAPMGGIGKWMNSLWGKYEKELKNQRELIRAMNVGTYIAIKDLDCIRVLVDKLEIQVESLLGNAELALAENGAVGVVVEEIKKKQVEFLETIDELGEHGDEYSRDIRRARTVILQRIIKHPNED